jgi:hypothetical protein
MKRYAILAAGSLLFAFLLVPSVTFAHCDTYSGPVIAAAKQALDKGDVAYPD